MLPAVIGLRVTGLGAETAAGAAADVTVAGAVGADVADAGVTDAAVMVEATAAVVVVVTKTLCHGFTRICADKSQVGLRLRLQPFLLGSGLCSGTKASDIRIGHVRRVIETVVSPEMQIGAVDFPAYHQCAEQNLLTWGGPVTPQHFSIDYRVSCTLQRKTAE